MKNQPSIAYIIDPRFPGGTSAAVASELKVVSKIGRVSVHAVSSRMFKGANIAPTIRDVLGILGLKLIWDAETICADIVILHNPSFLKFEKTLCANIIAKHLIIVPHENFYRPGLKETFHVEKCLDLIRHASLALRKSIAPISAVNRTATLGWLDRNGQSNVWSVLAQDWFNICDFQMLAPVDTPSDRRGRHSRPGIEKFPAISEMDLCFPKHAKRNVILGADLFLNDNFVRLHWQMYPFQGLAVAKYFEMVDFMVYFIAPTWQESFGRVVAEAVAAGKVVICDPQTAKNFRGVVAATPAQVDHIIGDFVQDPASYREQVTSAQKGLSAFSSSAFRKRFLALMDQKIGVPA